MKKITLSFIALLIFSTFLINCGGGAGGSSSPGGEKPGVPEIVQVLPSHYIAMTNSAILIRAKILNGNGGPVKNLPVTFTNTSPIGTLMNSNDAPLGNKTVVRTDDSGMATIKVKATTTGFVTVQAEVNKGVAIVRDRKTVYFSLFDMTLPSPPAPPAPSLTLDVDTDGLFTSPNENSDLNLFENATDNQVFVRATVFDSNHNVVSNSTVTFGAESTEASFPLGNSKMTNSSGQAIVLVQVAPSVLRSSVTILNITASASNGAANMVALFIQPITVSNIAVLANPSVVDSGGTSAITAKVFSNTGTLSPDGTTVNFRTCDATCTTCDATCTTTCGTIEPFAQTTNGVAPATFTAPSTYGTCTVGANVGLISGRTNVSVKAAELTVTPSSVSETGVAGVGDNVTFYISGGSGTYTGVFSNNTAVIPNPTIVGGNHFTIDPQVVAASTSVTLTVTDSLGATGTATVTVTPATSAMALNPSTIATVIGQTIQFQIIGGLSTYDVYTSDDTILTVGGGAKIDNLAITTFNALTIAAGSATVTVIDSDGMQVSATVTVTAPPAPPTPAVFAVTPLTATICENNTTCSAATDTAVFTISGGTPPYSEIQIAPAGPPTATITPVTSVMSTLICRIR